MLDSDVGSGLSSGSNVELLRIEAGCTRIGFYAFAQATVGAVEIAWAEEPLSIGDCAFRDVNCGGSDSCDAFLPIPAGRRLSEPEPPPCEEVHLNPGYCDPMASGTEQPGSDVDGTSSTGQGWMGGQALESILRHYWFEIQCVDDGF